MKYQIAVRTQPLETTGTLESNINTLLNKASGKDYSVIACFAIPEFTDSQGNKILPQIITVLQKPIPSA